MILGAVRAKKFESHLADLLWVADALGSAREARCCCGFDLAHMERPVAAFSRAAHDLLEPRPRVLVWGARLPLVYVWTSNNVSTADSGGAGSAGYEPGATGLRARLSSTHAVHGIRRLFVAFALPRAMLEAGWTKNGPSWTRRDHLRMAVPNHRNRPRQLGGYYESVGRCGSGYPVENASSCPGWSGTALDQFVSVTEKRGISRLTLLLAIFRSHCACVERSGALGRARSVHSLQAYSDPRLYILGSWCSHRRFADAYAWRAPKL